MANHHLRNRELSLKAKGLLSLMLSLPEDWDYTTKGLSCICKDGVDSICATIKELEKAGYVKRRRLRDTQGRLSDLEFSCEDSLSAGTVRSRRFSAYRGLGEPPQQAFSQSGYRVALLAPSENNIFL